MKCDTRLILALDETDGAKAKRIADEVAGLVDAIKINWPLVLSTSSQTITELSRKAPVICDFKVADIPNTTRLIVEQAVAKGASGVIVHAFVGSDSVRAAVEASKDADIFVVTEMSHPGGLEFTQPNADMLAKVAVDCGAAGVIAPATRPERIAHIRRIIGGLKILSPGVGAQGGSASDALRNGADYIIVGRAIYGAPNVRKAAEALVDEARDAVSHK
ncbi:MAG: orotidine-5'-phosphate decarboxylase [Euryarchaeota archaeon]|nr:orotidine-5'-phosphate decarboxylase [Euryarchaeota archaeon]